MHFHLQMVNDPATADRRFKSLHAHWAYLDEYAAHILARGPVVADDDETKTLGSIFFVEFADWNEVRGFIDNEPHNNNGIYKEVHVDRWQPALARSQRDFPGDRSQIHWYIRGYGVRGKSEQRKALLKAQREYFAPYDGDKVIVRGAILDDQGREWMGNAALIALPTRKDIDALMAGSPFFKNGLYDRVLVQRHKFGGGPA
jgi:uncharacterized protein YciI